MARSLKPPTPLDLAPGERSLFLAGSIEMGRAEQWQETVEHALEDLEVAVLNPRRDDWDSSWTQSIDDPMFRAQVEWELAGLEQATVIAFYFSPGTKSPITLLELGLHAQSTRTIVCCPEGYWRRMGAGSSTSTGGPAGGSSRARSGRARSSMMRPPHRRA